MATRREQGRGVILRISVVSSRLRRGVRLRGAHRPLPVGGGGVVAVGPSGGSTVKCNMGDGVAMGDTVDGEVMGADGCAPVSACRCSWGGRAHRAGLCLRLLCSASSPAPPQLIESRARSERLVLFGNPCEC